MIQKYILFNIFILYGFVLSDSLNTCRFNKYMLYYLKTKDVYFDKMFLCEPYFYENLIEYEEDLRSIGNAVLHMVNYLNYNHHEFDKSQGLLNLNLYLNNNLGTLMLRTYDGVNNTFYTGNNEKNILISELKKANNKLVESITLSIKYDCKLNNTKANTPFVFLRDPLEELDELNYLLPESWNLDATNCFFNKSVMDTFNTLDQSVIDLNFLTSQLWLIPSYYQILQPKYILFYDLFSNKFYENSLNMLRSIILKENLVDNKAANMIILFNMAQRVFDTTCLKSFHQQVLAAIVHPVYSCIGSYVQIVKKIFYNGEDKFADVNTRAEIYEQYINDKGQLIIKAFELLISANIYTGNAYYHLSATLFEFKKFVEFPNKKYLQTIKPKWINTIYNRCFNVMSLSLLKFENDDSIEVKNKEDFEEMVLKLGRIIVEVENYVKTIQELSLKYESSFRLFSHNYIFQHTIECNIIKNNKHGYHLFLNKESTFNRNQTMQGNSKYIL
ncbi:uncharacterized protein LOC126905435 [Daktulosphaira vitifoliae]|uniref:uncharacterized protein LOC126905435 n=1 Tax=Daktulosphaira vitifoliae TaxID=58002 RepID=UPI0021AA21C9|nr:uncharacterized protein LOC126905435 [Daktulosphaira vitifoliae]